MSLDEEAWRERIEWKLDRLAYHVSCLAMSARRPMLPPLPPLRRRSRVPLWPIIVRLLASYLLPAIGTIILFARHALARLWEPLLSAF